MKTPAALSARAAVFAIAMWVAAQAAHTAFLCPGHAAWTRARADPSAAVLERGERIARPDDAIFVCETTHRTGPVVWHMDTECDCAPAVMTAATVAMITGGTCRVDKEQPLPSDDWGSCRHGRCNRHLEQPSPD